MQKKRKIVVFGGGNVAKAMIGADKDIVVIGKDKLYFQPHNTTEAISKMHILLDDIGADAVINAIGYNSLEGCEKNPELANFVNGVIPGIIAKYCTSADIPVIHFSTESVFYNQGVDPITEDAIPNPANQFGASKLIGESEALTWQKTTVLRLPWLYSVNSENNLVFQLVKSLMNHREISAVEDQIGNLCNAFDLARFVIKLIDIMNRGTMRYDENDSRYGVYHLSGRGFASVYKIAQDISRTLERCFPDHLQNEKITPIKTADLPYSAKRNLNGCLHSGKIYENFKIHLPDWNFSLHNATQKIAKKIDPSCNDVLDDVDEHNRA